jgi:hypothetical protein
VRFDAVIPSADQMPYDFDSSLKELTNFQQHFILSPAKWRSFAPSPQLVWKKLKFDPSLIGLVPEALGIYAFVLQFQNHDAPPNHLPSHGYVLYVGITGHRAPQRTLRDRYRDYLREKTRAKRRQLWVMLNRWPDDLYFHFAEVGGATNLGQLETQLNDAILPPYVTNDFSPEVRALVRAFRIAR